MKVVHLLSALSMAASAFAQDDTTFTLSFDGPRTLSAPAGTTLRVPYLVTLTHEGDGKGALGWWYGVVADSQPQGLARIIAISLQGTDAGRHFGKSGMFNITSMTSGDGNEGAISVIVLGGAATLTPNRTSTLARVEVEVVIPAARIPVRLRFVDHLRGTGAPVSIGIVQDGHEYDPRLEHQNVLLQPTETCCDSQVSFGFSARRVSSGQRFECLPLCARLTPKPTDRSPSIAVPGRRPPPP